jgi:hypothetical protein
MHQLHHSAAPQHQGKNLGGMLSIWDGLAGTLYLPKSGEVFPLGVSEETKPIRTIADVYLTPFRDLTRLADISRISPKEIEPRSKSRARSTGVDAQGRK